MCFWNYTWVLVVKCSWGSISAFFYNPWLIITCNLFLLHKTLYTFTAITRLTCIISHIVLLSNKVFFLMFFYIFFIIFLYYLFHKLPNIFIFTSFGAWQSESQLFFITQIFLVSFPFEYYWDTHDLTYVASFVQGTSHGFFHIFSSWLSILLCYITVLWHRLYLNITIWRDVFL